MRAGLWQSARFLVGLSWGLNIALLLAAMGWVLFFGESRHTITLMRAAVVSQPTTSIIIRDPSRLGMGVAAGLMGTAAALCTGIVMLASLFAGGLRFRTTRMWLVFMAVTCGWLGLLVSWPTMYWFGQQQRMRRDVPAAEMIVETLRASWPKADSELPEIGPFLAYPISEPTVLLPLRQATFPGTGQRFSAVERTGTDVIRFELAGAETGAWLEWRGDGSAPRSFVGGLVTNYKLDSWARLAAKWFLVRYRVARLAQTAK